MSKPKMVVASGNQNKIREFSQLFTDYEVVSQKELGFDEDVEETGTTFAENALIKARAAAKALGVPALADDSGLCVVALGGQPGVYSARYSGDHDDASNRKKLLCELKGKQDRRAYFQSAIIIFPVKLPTRDYGATRNFFPAPLLPRRIYPNRRSKTDNRSQSRLHRARRLRQTEKRRQKPCIPCIRYRCIRYRLLERLKNKKNPFGFFFYCFIFYLTKPVLFV